jgi:hypothetical protein
VSRQFGFLPHGAVEKRIAHYLDPLGLPVAYVRDSGAGMVGADSSDAPVDRKQAGFASAFCSAVFPPKK